MLKNRSRSLLISCRVFYLVISIMSGLMLSISSLAQVTTETGATEAEPVGSTVIEMSSNLKTISCPASEDLLFTVVSIRLDNYSVSGGRKRAISINGGGYYEFIDNSLAITRDKASAIFPTVNGSESYMFATFINETNPQTIQAIAGNADKTLVLPAYSSPPVPGNITLEMVDTGTRISWRVSEEKNFIEFYVISINGQKIRTKEPFLNLPLATAGQLIEGSVASTDHCHEISGATNFSFIISCNEIRSEECELKGSSGVSTYGPSNAQYALLALVMAGLLTINANL